MRIQYKMDKKRNQILIEKKKEEMDHFSICAYHP